VTPREALKLPEKFIAVPPLLGERAGVRASMHPLPLIAIVS
jgi:hypothetical protein